MTIERTPSTDEDHVIRLKPPEKAISRPLVGIVKRNYTITAITQGPTE